MTTSSPACLPCLPVRLRKQTGRHRQAGAGKTALVTEFTRRAQAQHANLLVAIGNCNAHTGAGDPYLPFREMLRLLTADVEGRPVTPENARRLQGFLQVSGQALVELGPDLIDLFVPGAGLATRATGLLAGKLGWLDQLHKLTERNTRRSDEGLLAGRGVGGPQRTSPTQARIFEQYSNVLGAMAAQQPLLLVLDDLQWADPNSVNLLFHLGRRITSTSSVQRGDSRILIVGAYRPEEVALGRPSSGSGQVERHPLEKVVAEFKRYHGNVWVNLDEVQELEGRPFVDALLDSEPNRLDDDFRQALYEHTGGPVCVPPVCRAGTGRRTGRHPLFTVELLRALQERGDLVQDEAGRWVARPNLDWRALPARVEGVIEERIGRLEAELRDILSVASVEGEDFTAEVVARVRAVDERGVVRRLSGELEKQHRLVGARGVERMAQQRLSLYRFRHNLFQKYLYNNLDAVERTYLHEDVGTVLEALYGDQADQVAVQLAHHFQLAGLKEKALRYHLVAGEAAVQNYAAEEAQDHFETAQALLEGVPATDDAYLRLYKGLADVHFLLGQWDEGMDYLQRRLVFIDAHLDPDSPETRRLRAENLRWMAWAYLNITPEAGKERLAQAFATLGEPQDRQGIVEMVRLLATRAWLVVRNGEYTSGLEDGRRALALAEAVQDPESEMWGLNAMHSSLWMLNRLPEALDVSQQMQRINLDLGDQHWQEAIHEGLCVTYWLLGEFKPALVAATDHLKTAKSLGMDLSFSKWLIGVCCFELGDLDEAEVWLREALSGFRAHQSNHMLRAMVLRILAVIYQRRGRLADAQRYSESARLLGQSHSVAQLRDWFFALRADLYLELGRIDEALELLEECLAFSRETQSPWGEGVALRLLGRASCMQGDLDIATEHLTQSVAILAELGSQVEHGRSLYEYGLLQRAQGNDEAATALFEQARDIFEDKGAKYDRVLAEDALNP